MPSEARCITTSWGNHCHDRLTCWPKEVDDVLWHFVNVTVKLLPYLWQGSKLMHLVCCVPYGGAACITHLQLLRAASPQYSAVNLCFTSCYTLHQGNTWVLHPLEASKLLMALSTYLHIYVPIYVASSLSWDLNVLGPQHSCLCMCVHMCTHVHAVHAMDMQLLCIRYRQI